MNFEFSEDQQLLQSTAREFLADQDALAAARRVLDADEPFDRDLWKGIAEMGWLGTVVPEEQGGAGFGYLELAMVAEELGRSLAPTPFSSSVYLATEALLIAGKDDQKRRFLPGLATGDLIGTAASIEVPGDIGLESIETTFSDGALNGKKIAVPDGDVADIAIVAARGADGAPVLALVELNQNGVSRQVARSIDPSRPQAVVSFENAAAELLGSPGEGRILGEKLGDRAAVLVAFEQLGGAEQCLETARDFALERYAFGRPIGSFQAIKHRLADMFVSVELARSNCYYGAWALSSGSDELPIAACLARISATEAYEFCAREGLQIHGGVGFTWEYDCHLFLRRSKLLAVALGPANIWKRRLIEKLDHARAA